MYKAIFLVLAFIVIGEIGLGDSQEVNLTAMQDTLLQLQASVEKLTSTGEELRAENKEQDTKIQEQAMKIQEQDNKTKHLNVKLSHKVDLLRGMGSESLDGVAQLMERVSNLERGEVVAFSTYLTVSGGYFTPSGNEVVVPFNQIITNIGGHFSSSRHKFRCPVDGYYMFVYSINSGDIRRGSGYRSVTYGQLMKDGTEVNRVYCHTYTEESIMVQASNSAVVRCERNSDVYVVTADSSSQIHTWSRYSTFSGFLIKSV